MYDIRQYGCIIHLRPGVNKKLKLGTNLNHVPMGNAQCSRPGCSLYPYYLLYIMVGFESAIPRA